MAKILKVCQFEKYIRIENDLGSKWFLAHLPSESHNMIQMKVVPHLTRFLESIRTLNLIKV
ncbi:hypothetical protein RBK84_00280, partial [Pseudomonas aeruginosa]|uniref:hypothetical protein n=1 Tax=Pseudomonas aeruginosa TaxID=287 RepID=UPI0027D39A0E